MSDDFFYKTNELAETGPKMGAPWKILVVDDDEDVHTLTRLTLDAFQFDNRPLQILDAYSGGEAIRILEKNPETALLLLDVVMETEDAGLRVVKHIRKVLKNELVRIVLRTGQPGHAPETAIIRDYDINDYKDKTELSSQKMITTLYTALRSYRDLETLENSNRSLLESQLALRQANQDLNTYIRELETLDGIVKAINKELDSDRLFDSILSQGLKLFPRAERGLLWLTHENDNMGLAAVIGYHKESLAGIKLGRKELTRAYTSGENWGEGIYLVRAQDLMENKVFKALQPCPYMLVMLLTLDNQVKGCLVWDGERPFDRSDASKLRRFSQHAVAAVVKARHLKTLQKRQLTSPTTASNLTRIVAQAQQLSVADRTDFVREECGNNNTLYLKVLSELSESDETQILPRMSPQSESSNLVGKHIGAYKLKRELGRGGMGAVYLAERDDTELSMFVAIKLIHRCWALPELIRRFLQERQLLANLRHPHIAMLMDAGKTDEGLPYFIMEYVAGETIELWCESQKLTSIDRLQLFLKVLDAVAYAHEKGVIHRDLKPGNIMVSEAGDPKLLDFGIARLNDSLEQKPLTLTGQPPMTPEYAAPEQLYGMMATVSSDIYSLGLVLLQMLVGARPRCEGRTPRTAVKCCILDNVVLARIMHRMLRNEPDMRYSSCDQLTRDINELLDSGELVELSQLD